MKNISFNDFSKLSKPEQRSQLKIALKKWREFEISRRPNIPAKNFITQKPKVQYKQFVKTNPKIKRIYEVFRKIKSAFCGRQKQSYTLCPFSLLLEFRYDMLDESDLKWLRSQIKPQPNSMLQVIEVPLTRCDLLSKIVSLTLINN